MAGRDQLLTKTADLLRHSFWLEAAVAVVLAAGLGLFVPAVDRWLDLDVPLLAFGGGTASSVLETIATVAMAVAGISFSVIMVAFTLASQQHGPRVLPTFQADRLSHTVLALFLGTFMYCLVVLARIRSDAEGAPELAVTVAIALAALSFGFFIAFIHHVVRMLQISDIIRRIAEDGRHAIGRRFPDDLGAAPRDPQAAAARLVRRTAAAPTAVAGAARGGFLRDPESEIDGPPARNLAEWDRLCARRRCVAIGGLDAHESGLRLARRLHTPFSNLRFLRYLRTHVLCERPPARELEVDRAQIFDALAEGRCYLGMDALGSPKGFRLWAEGPSGRVEMGGERRPASGRSAPCFPASPS
jgi:hypothetical protein